MEPRLQCHSSVEIREQRELVRAILGRVETILKNRAGKPKTAIHFQ